MDRNFDLQTITANDEKLAERTADLFRNCVEQLRTPGGASIVDVYYDNNGDQAASRILKASSVEYNFKADGKTYDLKEGAFPSPGLYRIDDTKALTKIEIGSAEYEKAMTAVRAIKFDSLPRC